MGVTGESRIFTFDELEEMDRCFNRIQLTLLMMTAVVHNLPVYLDAKAGSNVEVDNSTQG